jgi:hypothetical protein
MRYPLGSIIRGVDGPECHFFLKHNFSRPKNRVLVPFEVLWGTVISPQTYNDIDKINVVVIKNFSIFLVQVISYFEFEITHGRNCQLQKVVSLPDTEAYRSEYGNEFECNRCSKTSYIDGETWWYHCGKCTPKWDICMGCVRVNCFYSYQSFFLLVFR